MFSNFLVTVRWVEGEKMVTCYSLNREIRHLERSFHLSSTQGGLSPPLTTLGDYQPLERIITSH